MNTTHDIRLGPWGPYSKKYAGISHIPDIAAGMRFDFFVMPGFYRNKVLIPNVNFESGYFPWQADSRQGSYTYRYELIWKDQVYVDVNYQIVDSSKVIVSIKCVNRTELPQSLALNLMASMNYPEVWPRFKLQKSSQDVWINAVDYKQIRFARQEPKDNLVTDGLMNGEMRNEGFIDGSALTKKFGQSAGNSLSYSIPAQFKKGYLTIFYRADIGAVSRISASGAIHQQIILEGDGKLKWIEIPFEWDGSGRLILTSLEGDGVELNGLLWSIKKDTKFAIEDNLKVVNPKVSTDFKNRQAILKYQHAPGYYGMSWGNSSYKIREIRNDELDVYFRKAIHNHVDSILKGNNQGHFENIFIRPLVLLAGSEKTFSCVLTHNPSMAAARQNMSAPKNIPQKAQKPFIGPTFLPESKTYAFSQKMLRAALLENIVYPIYTQRSYIRHYTPGKWWNSLYTWDSGFIALGLNELDINRAVECINAYTTEPGSQSAFIHHGAPVPVQVYAFFDLLNKTQSLPLLEYFYPRLKQYYSFLSGKLGSSSTGRLKSGLLNTWDYFYNSGGWDDYPAQVGIHQQRLESTVSPVITTAQCIRFAKILRMLAKKLNKNADAADYDIEIKAFSKSLQAYSWNEESGYFSYVRHDSSGKAIGAFRYKDGSDYNQGMDGAYPLFAGICTPAQQNILLKKLFSADHMWTPYGMGVVDRAAAYYLNDGYWNGSVWMPHQWFMWKTMLDLGKPELAMRISSTGLEVFKRETDHSYYTFEHYLSETGRGAGWHQFSGLSTPVLNWYNSTFKIGNVTTGFEILQEKSEFNSEFSNYEALLSFDDSTPAHARSMLICLNPSYQYQAMFNGRVIQHLQPYPGLLQVTLPATNVAGQLIIKIKGRK
ncbi:trehalase family glycosidase [Pedobacter lithocola]|nr:alpha,alpha-trehalase [Pedobacter petrophilus]